MMMIYWVVFVSPCRHGAIDAISLLTVCWPHACCVLHSWLQNTFSGA